MPHSYASDDEYSVATFHTAGTQSFHSVSSTIDEFLKEKGNQEEEVAMRDGNSNILLGSGFVNRFTSRAHDRAATLSGEPDGPLRLQHYLRQKMLRQLHQGANGETYLAELTHKGARTLYTVKVIRKDHCRKVMERNVLKSLRHPFLPNVHADVESLECSFLVMDFCPGGDLRSLLRRSPLSEAAAKFYATEVLLAMEYLHEHGIIYGGLKPEHVLVKANGHVMLSGFEYATWRPRLLQNTFWLRDGLDRENGIGSSDHVVHAPEVVRGKEHGTAADWYTYGVFLYELLFRTPPFKAYDGRTNCINVVFSRQRRVKFPQEPMVSPAARDLLTRLLNENPKRRLGRKGGAAEVKQHAFFQGINFARVQKMASAGCMSPPELPIKF